jgi:hypothetical protein
MAGVQCQWQSKCVSGSQVGVYPKGKWGQSAQPKVQGKPKTNADAKPSVLPYFERVACLDAIPAPW